MASFYTIIQYVPSPSIDERINAGVVVFGNGRIRAKFVDDWDRLRRFGRTNVEFLLDFAKDFRSSVRSKILPINRDDTGRLDEATLRDMIVSSSNEIRFTPLRGSIAPVDELFHDIVARFLRQPAVTQSVRRHTSRYAATLAENVISEVVDRRIGVGAHEAMVFRDTPIKGLRDNRKFDVVVMNGTPWLAADGLSFERPDTPRLEEEVGATLWAMRDVRDGSPDFPVAVVVLPPRHRSEIYDKAAEILNDLNVPMIRQGQIADWATAAIDKHAA